MPTSIPPPKNDVLLHLQQAHNFSLMSANQSLSFGRRLYRYKNGQQYCWLKTQLIPSTAEQQIFAQAFKNELQCYQFFAAQNALFVLPNSIQIKSKDLEVEVGQYALHVLEAEALFSKQTSTFCLDDIIHRIFLALHALEELHDLGYIHADLKRSHWRLFQGKAKLIDFEYCHQIGKPQQGMQATPRYMAPELFRGQEKSIQSDLYALGIILLEWLSEVPLQADDYMGWAVLHCQHLKPDLSEAFNALLPFVQRLLIKQKAQRFNNVREAKYYLMTEIE